MSRLTLVQLIHIAQSSLIRPTSVSFSTMKARKSIQIVIVGAGMGGLGAAIALRRAGHKVIVLEQAAEFGEVHKFPTG